MPPTEERDPWLDNEFSQLDTRTGPQHFAEKLAEIANNDPDSFPPPVDPALAPVAPAPAAVYAQQETIQLENGATITYTEDERGWHAELDPGKGRPLEVFHARSPLELAKQLAVGKVNASIKINQQESKLKTVQKVDNTSTTRTPQPASAAPKQATADQLFEIKTLFQSDPVAAFNRMCEVTTGVDWTTFVGWAKAGKEGQEQAQQQATLKQIGDKFRRLVPAYYNSPENNDAISAYLTEKELFFNVENLIEAYQELSKNGLLEEAPRPQPVPAAPVAITTPPAPASPDPAARIERPVGRPIAAPGGFGLRPGESSARPPVPPDTTRAPSVEEMDNLPDADINQLFTDIRRFKAQSARR